MLSLRARGVRDTDVLRAMETVPREVFAPRRFADLARADVALPLACGQTMTSPGTVAAMLAALDVRPGHRVLEIGTGSGYVSALLARIGATVRSFERKQVLAEAAWHRLNAVGLARAVELGCGDGLEGGPEAARYDRILVNGSAARLGAALTSRLAASGRLVGAVTQDGVAQLLTISRGDEGQLVRTLGCALRISPLVEPANLGSESCRATEV